MFNDHQDDQAHTNTDIDTVAQDIASDKPTLGLGTNPTTFSPVMPPQASTPPPPPADSNDNTASTTTPSSVAPTISSHNSPQVGSTATPTPPPAGLDEIKNKALEQLSPLVGKLDQPAEERFKTLMMLIQASDNHELIKEAYEAANSIQDEASKAEALLAIVNEINYFTQQKNN